MEQELLQPKQIILKEKIWIPSQDRFKFVETLDPRSGEKKFVLQGLMLPFSKISRNGILYNTESIREKHQQLIGKSVMYNHLVEGNNLPIGHYINSFIKEDGDVPGWYYEADIDPEEKDIIRKLSRGDLRHVSIQLVGSKAVERFNEKDGGSYTEAYVGDIIEGSVVPAPGFLDTTAKFSEALHPKESMTTSTAAGVISTKPLEDDAEAADIAASIIEKMGENDAQMLLEALQDSELRRFVIDSIDDLRVISNCNCGNMASKLSIKEKLTRIRNNADSLIQQL